MLAEGDTGFVYMDLEITTTYLELGQPQSIASPPADNIVEE